MNSTVLRERTAVSRFAIFAFTFPADPRRCAHEWLNITTRNAPQNNLPSPSPQPPIYLMFLFALTSPNRRYHLHRSRAHLSAITSLQRLKNKKGLASDAKPAMIL